MKTLFTKWFYLLKVLLIAAAVLSQAGNFLLVTPQKAEALLPGYFIDVDVQGSTYDYNTKKLKIIVKNNGNLDGDIVVTTQTYNGLGNAEKKQTITMPVSTLLVGKNTSKEITFTPSPTERALRLHVAISKNLGLDSNSDYKDFTFPLPDLEFQTLRYESGKGVLVEIKNHGAVDARISANTVFVDIGYPNQNQTGSNVTPNLYSKHYFALNARTIKPGEVVTLPHIKSTPPIDAVQIRGAIYPGTFAEQNVTSLGNKISTNMLKPKLVVGSETAYDSTARKVNVVIKNEGLRDAFIPGTDDVKATFKYNYAQRASFTEALRVPTNTIPSKGSITIPLTFLHPVDLVSIEVGLQTSDKFLEFDKNHGSKLVEIGLPDLAIIDGGLDKDGNIFAKVKSFNNPAYIFGSTSKKVSVDFYNYYANGSHLLFASRQIPGDKIDANGEVTLTTNLKPSTSAPQIEMIVNDSGYVIPESNGNPQNNRFVFDVDIADFAVKAELVDGIYWGGKVTVSNEGTKASNVTGITGQMIWHNEDGTSKTDNFSLSGMLAPGGTKVFNTQQLQSPEKVTKLEAKITNLFYAEKDSGVADNNNKSEVLTKRRPDLKIKSLTRVGNKIMMKVTNTGTKKSTGVMSVEYYFEDGKIESKGIGGYPIEIGGELERETGIQIPKLSGLLTVMIKTNEEEQIPSNNWAELYVIGTEPIESILGEGFSFGEMIADEISASVSGKIDPEKFAGLLPDSPFYFAEEIGDFVSVGLTFDDESKAEKLKDIADEKMVETAVLIDKDKTKVAIDSLSGYKDTLEELLKVSEPPTTDDTPYVLYGELVDSALIQMPVLDALEASTKEVEDSVQVKLTRDEILGHLGETIDNVKDQNSIADKITKADTVRDDMFLPLKDLVAINEITSHIASGKVRDILLGAKERHQSVLKNNLQSLDDKGLAQFSEFVDNSTGDKVNALKALDDVKIAVTDSKVKGVLAGAKKEVAQNLIKDMKAAKGKKLKAGDAYLSDLEGGTITDLRVLADLKSADNDIAKNIASAKKNSISNFEKHVKSLKSSEKEAYLKDITVDRLDLTQQAVAADIKRALPNSKLGDELDTTLKTEVKTKVSKVKGNKEQYNEFLVGATGDTVDDKEAIQAFTAGFDSSFFKDIMRQQLTFMKSFYADADPELKKLLDENYFNDPQIKAFYTDFDSAYSQLFSGFEDLDFGESSEETYEEESFEEPYEDDTNTTSGCSMTYDPVCGTDGLNYSNECEAKDNGVDVAYAGECSEESSVEAQSSESEESNEDESAPEEEVEGASTRRFIIEIPPWWPFSWP